MSEARNQVVVDITIAAPIDMVWAALREPARIGQWFGWDAPSLAEEIRFIFVDGATADVATHFIQFEEWEGVSYAIELTDEGTVTRLCLVQSGGSPIDWAGAYDEISEGWVTFFQQLRLALELHPGKGRRTIYLSGPSRPGIGEPSDELGLGAATDLAPGAAHRTELAIGDSVSGKVWYRTHFQTGLTVAQWGEGLLVVTDMGVSTKRPHGGGSVLLTTYGLSDTDFGALEQRLRDLWVSRYPVPAG